MLIDTSESELSISLEHIDSMVYNTQIKAIRLIYFVPKKRLIGDDILEKRYDEFECCEYQLLLKTFNNVRLKVMTK